MLEPSRDTVTFDEASFVARINKWERDVAALTAIWNLGANSADDWFRAVDLLRVAQRSEHFRKVLEAVCGAPLSKITIGRYLGSRVRYAVDGLKVMRYRAHGGQVRYWMESEWLRKLPHPMDWRPLRRPVTWAEWQLYNWDKSQGRY